MVETEDLYTAADVKRVRELLLKEQRGKCALSGQTFPAKDYHLDHNHSESQLVRAALYKQSNMVLGKVEGLWVRFLAYWYEGTLSDFLRQTADYIEEHEGESKERRWRHVGWQKRVKVAFNKLSSVQQNNVLEELGYDKGSNPKQRKDIFTKLVLDRKLGYNTIMQAIKQNLKEQDVKS